MKKIINSSLFTVTSTSVSQQHRKLNVVDQQNRKNQLKVHRLALVGAGDTVFINPSNNDIHVLSLEDHDSTIPVTPNFEKNEVLKLGDTTIQFLVKEITTRSELDDYLFLEGYHYKTSSAIISDESDNIGNKHIGTSNGRRSVLMCYMRYSGNWIPVGYIELQMPLLMVKPRHVLFNHPYEHPSRPIKWESWNLETIRENVNLIVRIARVVTSPDLRGLGLAHILVKSAKQFVVERWQIRGRRPVFIEISAEMLKYLDFVSNVGLFFIGNTEGNLTRVHQDLLYMSRGYAASSGIMTLQKKYLTKLQELSNKNQVDFYENLDKLKQLTKDVDENTLREKLNKLEPKYYYMYKKVLRFPIPYYLGGLDDYSQQYIQTNLSNYSSPVSNNVSRTRMRINLKNVTINSHFQIPDSLHVRAIKDSFGIEGDHLNSTLIDPISIEASPGNIVMIIGPNGSGKSILLKSMDPTFKDPNLEITMDRDATTDYNVAWMNEIESDKTIIEYFSDRWGIDAAISALNRAGLSEAFIYLKPYKLLSRGQQYRARLAELILSDRPVWIVDEFCADLDPFMAKIVANNFRKHIIKYSKIAFVAAANYSHYINVLKPTMLIMLRQNSLAKVMNYQEYYNEFHRKAE